MTRETTLPDGTATATSSVLPIARVQGDHVGAPGWTAG